MELETLLKEMYEKYPDNFEVLTSTMKRKASKGLLEGVTPEMIDEISKDILATEDAAVAEEEVGYNYDLESLSEIDDAINKYDEITLSEEIDDSDLTTAEVIAILSEGVIDRRDDRRDRRERFVDEHKPELIAGGVGAGLVTTAAGVEGYQLGRYIKDKKKYKAALAAYNDQLAAYNNQVAAANAGFTPKIIKTDGTPHIIGRPDGLKVGVKPNIIKQPVTPPTPPTAPTKPGKLFSNEYLGKPIQAVKNAGSKIGEFIGRHRGLAGLVGGAALTGLSALAIRALRRRKAKKDLRTKLAEDTYYASEVLLNLTEEEFDNFLSYPGSDELCIDILTEARMSLIESVFTEDDEEEILNEAKYHSPESNAKFVNRHNPENYVINSTIMELLPSTISDGFSKIFLGKESDNYTKTEAQKELAERRLEEVKNHPELMAIVRKIKDEATEIEPDRKKIRELYKEFKRAYKGSTLRGDVNYEIRMEKINSGVRHDLEEEYNRLSGQSLESLLEEALHE